MAYAIESKTKGTWNFLYSCFCRDIKTEENIADRWIDIETEQRFWAECELKSAKKIAPDSILKHYSEIEV
jgi:hypothetical protein